MGKKKTEARKRMPFVAVRAHLAETADHIVSYIQNVVQDTQVSLETAGNALPAIPEEKRLPYLQDIARRHKFAYVGYAEQTVC